MKLVRDLHKYFGLVIVALVILVAATGILLTHDKLFRLDQFRVDVPGYANALPPDVWDIVALDDGTLVAATRDGVVVSSGSGWSLTLPEDARALASGDGRIVAATRGGLFTSVDRGAHWSRELDGDFRALASTTKGIVAASRAAVLRYDGARWELLGRFDPRHLAEVRAIAESPSGLTLASKNGLFLVAGGEVRQYSLPPHARESGVELKKLVTDLHTGKFFGNWFVVFSDANALGLILLSLSGAWLWWYPRQRRREAAKKKAKVAERSPSSAEPALSR